MRTKIWMDSCDFAKFAQDLKQEFAENLGENPAKIEDAQVAQREEKLAQDIVEFKRAWAQEVIKNVEEYPMLAHFERAKIARARRGVSVATWEV